MLEFIKINGKTKWGAIQWEMKCECGEIFTAKRSDIKSGHTKSCGCLQRRKLIESNYTHGGTGTNLYIRWGKIKARCYNKKQYGYDRYGGRGIKICEEWLDYAIFKKWALENGYEEHLTIERIDVDKDYCPENCTWIEKSEQSKNTCQTIRIEIEGKEICLKDACKHYNISYLTVRSRMARGKSIIEALTKEVDEKCRNKRAN